MLLGRWGVTLRANRRSRPGGGTEVETCVEAVAEDSAGFRAGVRPKDILKKVADVDCVKLEAVRSSRVLGCWLTG